MTSAFVRLISSKRLAIYYIAMSRIIKQVLSTFLYIAFKVSSESQLRLFYYLNALISLLSVLESRTIIH